ncbi:MAG: PEGA domain-containing protein [Draconibacterium sp.]|nr:PEGA domain-containing protein [Draconibacterium sp.]
MRAIAATALNIKSLPAGVYRVSFKKMGYAEQFATVNVNDGELTTVDIALNKN